MIRTNKLDYSLNRSKIVEKYDFFRIVTTDSHFKSGAKMLDAPVLEKNTCAIRFESGKDLLVMMRKDPRNRKLLRDAVASTDGADKITIDDSGLVEDFEMLQLLLNGFSCYEMPELRFSNLTGHLYCFHPKWIKYGEKGTVVWQIPCLELRVTEELRLSLNIRTFSSGKLQKKISFKKKKYAEYPKYIFSAKNTLRRKLNDDDADEFILRQLDNEKTDIVFLDTQSLDRFAVTKMGVLSTVIEQFNSRYDGLAHIDFLSINPEICMDFDVKAKKTNDFAIKLALKDKKIVLVDKINDDQSLAFLESIQKVLKDKWALDSVVRKNTVKDSLNICLIHDADYYEGINDPHSKYYDASVQHITREKYDCNSKFTAEAVIHELLIKSDIQSKKISLFDWTSLGFDSDISFGLKDTDDEKVSRYFFMTVHKDGTFDVREQQNDLFEHSIYDACMQVFDEAEMKKENAKGVIMDSEGNINVIKDTEWITIPEISLIKKELESGNNMLRSKEKRDELLTSSLDIKYFEDKGSPYYFVGLIGRGMKYDVHNAANIRCIQPYGNAPLFFKKLLPLMNVNFVKNEQLTVIPFPFKYLREWIALNV